uniref:Uncharacterized protein n=1 Tax=Pseudo-nitzschia australis TaxID=44445 RepID=A0A7S4AKZ6_9STRA|mmetsp:Transcript_24643/g.54026  ORF Transcript_24643/g.54026 Transcript_24643/m.54026 type:complete len:464 (+) Transcript_24643:233-1624(+)|eukprot:CAMPEP_0168199588 /NCGR_PEP_ID=MMETSP0139_2-20121125/22514_1 /TAXON_ID=44445 /ORGANISM="Pseudo-nitzschia australis, Strain 10249 10 AB" /LENGTH=463 /DNA_ID=CAMNT_0008124609 /DNA_START=332 /DNA_END=1723 /DNA_ORIENTATION=+
MLTITSSNETAIVSDRCIGTNIYIDEKASCSDFDTTSLEIVGRKSRLEGEEVESSTSTFALTTSPSPLSSLSSSPVSSTRDALSALPPASLHALSVPTNSQNNSTNKTNDGSKPYIFSRYWGKTGRKPIPLRSMRSPAAQTTSTASPVSPSRAAADAYYSSYSSSCLHVRSHAPQDPDALLRSVTNAELLEDENDFFRNNNGNCHSNDAAVAASLSSSRSQSPRRRSILPIAPLSHPALKSTIKSSSTRNIWRKSVSSPNVVAASHRLLGSTDKRFSLPRSSSSVAPTSISTLTSSSMLTPGASCLRPFQKYSHNRKDVKSVNVQRSVDFSKSWTALALLSSSPSSKSSSKSMRTFTTIASTVAESASAPATVSGSTPTSTHTQATYACARAFTSTITSTTMPKSEPFSERFVPISRDSLCRENSSSSLASVSSVSFLEAVDVRHFEKPRETYAPKGWSAYFN